MFPFFLDYVCGVLRVAEKMTWARQKKDPCKVRTFWNITTFLINIKKNVTKCRYQLPAEISFQIVYSVFALGSSLAGLGNLFPIQCFIPLSPPHKRSCLKSPEGFIWPYSLTRILFFQLYSIFPFACPTGTQRYHIQYVVLSVFGKEVTRKTTNFLSHLSRYQLYQL